MPLSSRGQKVAKIVYFGIGLSPAVAIYYWSEEHRQRQMQERQLAEESSSTTTATSSHDRKRRRAIRQLEQLAKASSRPIDSNNPPTDE
eukprot:g1370.t1